MAAIEMGGRNLAKFFCGFCREYDEVFCEEKKRIENRSEERKGRKVAGSTERERERKKETIKAISCPKGEMMNAPPCLDPCHPDPG